MSEKLIKKAKELKLAMDDYVYLEASDPLISELEPIKDSLIECVVCNLPSILKQFLESPNEN